MDKHILKVKDLRVSYEEGKEVLNHVSFQVKEGETVGLVGESGCGKSTLAKAILGMVPIQEGEVVHYSSMPQMVFQDPYSSLNPAKKIGWILEEPLKIQKKLNKGERREKAEQMMERVGLDPAFLERYPNMLSGGQRQRVAIALALMLDSKLIIADEAVSALDVTVQAQILDLFLKIQREMGVSFFFISHDLRVVYHLCHYVLVMKEGKIVEAGDVEQVYFTPRDNYTKTLLKAADIGS
ncbi:MAG: ABC transporter ATP-binding protein [Lachnospiraceae bacterium]|nr:ABC transporter ATP-binding protein [Lachnospiraceae bacterium]